MGPFHPKRLFALAGVLALGALANPVHAQVFTLPPCSPPANPGCPSPIPAMPTTPLPTPWQPATPAPTPTTPATPETPTPTPPETPAPTTPDAATQPQVDLSLPGDTSLALGGGAEALGGVSSPGYVESAIPFSKVRMRYEAAYRNNRPDRAEFFYAKAGTFRNLAFTDPTNPNADINAPGPNGARGATVDYQDADLYLEYAPSARWSVFVEAPYRWVNFTNQSQGSGVGDTKIGFKYALVAEQDRFFTVQMRTFIPTGNAFEGVGTNHVSIEPAALLFTRLGEKTFLDSEFRVWVPVGGTDFQGNVLRYGAALSYLAYEQPCLRVFPMAEMVGWTFLNGSATSLATPIETAGGVSVLNAKVGVRVGFGELLQPGYFSRSDLYVGYGRALTGEVLYKDMLRVEYRINF